MKPLPKPTIDEILEQKQLCENHYANLMSRFDLDEEFYELEFKNRLDIPEEFASSAIVLPTARDDVDTFVDHIDLANARVHANKKGIRKMDIEEQEMMRKFYLGIIYDNLTQGDISPFRVSGKHYAAHGMAVLGTFWDPDMWPDKPEQGDSETEEEYAERLDKWRAETHNSIPIVIRAIHPANILLDPGYGGRLYVIERQQRTAFEIKRRWPHWKGPLGGGSGTKIECLSYWDKNYRCELVGEEPVLKVVGGVVEHNYGFLSYTVIESGLGNLSKDATPEKRYVGILRYMYDLLISQSRSYSLNDLVLSRSAMPYLAIEGDDTGKVTEWVQRFGVLNHIPTGVKITEMVPKSPPEALRTHLAITSDFIDAHAAPRSVRGLSESGVRSRVDRDRVISEGSAKYNYAIESFRNGVAQVLIKCAMLYKNVIPGNIQVWAKTPADEMAVSVEIDKEKMREPFSCYVEFSSLSEEDEYRRHLDLIQLKKEGMVTKRWARSQMPNVDAVAMGREELKESIIQSPAIQQWIQQYVGARLQAALYKKAEADVVSGVTPSPPQAPPQPGQPPTSPGRPLVPNVQKVPNQLETIGNEMNQTRKEMAPFTGQGMGGGGNTL